MAHIVLVIVAAVLMLPGIPLVFTPLPSLLYMLVIALGFGFLDKFAHLTGGELWILVGVFAVSIIVDQLSGILGARYGGASAKSIGYGLIGMIVGTILLPPFGGMLGLFVAVALGEYQNHKNHQRALKAATGSFIGTVAGKFANAVVALAFVVLFTVFSV